MLLDITLDLDPIWTLIIHWIARVSDFMQHTYFKVGGQTFSLWNFTIAAMIIAFSIAALLPLSPAHDLSASEADEFYDDGYFDDDRYQL